MVGKLVNAATYDCLLASRAILHSKWVYKMLGPEIIQAVLVLLLAALSTKADRKNIGYFVSKITWYDRRNSAQSM